MNRANVADLRKALASAKTYADNGILFVAVPVLDSADYIALHAQAIERFDKLIAEADDEQA